MNQEINFWSDINGFISSNSNSIPIYITLIISLVGAIFTWPKWRFRLLKKVKILAKWDHDHSLFGWNNNDHSYINVSIINLYQEPITIEKCVLYLKSGSNSPVVHKFDHLRMTKIEGHGKYSRTLTFSIKTEELRKYQTFNLSVILSNDKVYKSKNNLIFG